MSKRLTYAMVAAVTNRKVENKDVKDFVDATNAYIKMWPSLLHAALKHRLKPIHLKMLRIENRLNQKQKMAGMRLGVLAK